MAGGAWWSVGGAWGLTVNSRTTPPGGDGSGPVRPRQTTPPTGRPTTSAPAAKSAGPPISGGDVVSAVERQGAHAGRKAAGRDARAAARPAAPETSLQQRTAKAPHDCAAPAVRSRRRTAPPAAAGSSRSIAPTIGSASSSHLGGGPSGAPPAEPPIDPMSAFSGPTPTRAASCKFRNQRAATSLTSAILIRPYPDDRQKDSAIRIWTDGLRRAVRAQHSSRNMFRCRPAARSARAIRS